MAKPKETAEQFADRIDIPLVGRIYDVFGATDDEVAKVVGVSRQTIDTWSKKHLSLRNARKQGKDFADDRVVRRLSERACGYSHTETKVFYNAGKDKVVTTEIIRHYPPDPTSMIFWLKNRKPGEWRDVKDIRTAKDQMTKAAEELILEGKKQFGPDFVLQIKSLIETLKEAEPN